MDGSDRLAVDRVEAGGFVWRVNRALRGDLAAWMDDPAGGLEAAAPRVIKRNSVRTVYFLRMGARDYYVKRYAGGGFLERLKARWGETKAAREWRVMRAGCEAGLPVPVPGATGERWEGGRLVASYLATVAIADARDLVPHLEAYLRADRPARHAFLRRLGAAVRRLHEAGLFHRDLHSGNVLVQRGADGAPVLHFIDLHRGSVRRRLGRRARRWNLAFLLHSTSGVTDPDDRLEVLRGYAAAGGDGGGLGEVDAVARWVERRILRFERRRLRSRTRRCLVDSSQFKRLREPAGLLHVDRSFGAEAARAVLAAYREGAGVAELKRTRRTRVAALDDPGGRPVVVKEYFARRLDRAGGGRGRAAWRAAHGLGVRGFPAARPLACFTPRRGGGFVVMERARGVRLDHHVIARAAALGEGSRAFRAELDRVGRAVADLVRRLHEQGVYHGDLKACNLFVALDGGAGAAALTLVDLDRVVFADRPLGRRRRIKNLAQLHAAVPTHVSRRARCRWFRRYASAAVYRERRRYYEGVRRACARKLVVDREPIE
ncbi:MAG: hypothetical protein JXQ29_08955 [Planctomycetes bacterium]|nr:hypothetical protein [Planctomycetota bacterium]